MATFNEILSRLENVKRTSDGKATARCPAHADHDNSLSIAEGDKGVVLHCFAGCSVDAICGAMSIAVSDLFPPVEKKRKPREPEPPLTLAELAKAKQLPEDWLRDQGLEDWPNGSGVCIGYFYEDESQHPRMRKRTSLKGGWSWRNREPGEAPPLIPYGVWRLAAWRQ